MDPYRSAEPDALAQAPADQGIVGDVIAQFADPLAFYRELVQNAIDAGSPSIEVRLAHDAEADKLVVAVIDRGEGMSREVIENQLLVLFRSTKETDATKIGKFGIGFASVLAPNPSLVRVTSARDGRRLELHLARDLTYRLFEAGPATRAGTTVELELAMPRAEVGDFVTRSRDALVRWCRHATVPIELHALQEAPTRIDRPLAIEGALVSIETREDDGRLAVIVGVCADRSTHVGFYNHGLTLYETTDDLVGGGRVVVKIQDARLGHTLSRDDVRRDAMFEHAIAVARRLARDRLPTACATAIAAAATGDPVAHGALVDAVARAGVVAPTWTFPLAVPFGEARTCDVDTLTTIWASAQGGELARLASDELGVPILACHDRPTLEARIARIFDKPVKMVERELTQLAPDDLDDDLATIFAALAEILDRVYRAPRAIVGVELAGAHADVFALAGSTRGRQLVDRDEAAASPFARLKRPPLAINVRHPFVTAARALPVATGASLLARQLLLAHRALDTDRSTDLLADVLARLGVS